MPLSMGFGVEECSWNVGFRGSIFKNFFNDWASHEEVKVYKSLQSLRATHKLNEQTLKVTTMRTKTFGTW